MWLGFSTISLKLITNRSALPKKQDARTKHGNFEVTANKDGRLETPKYPNNAEREHSKQWRAVMRQINTEKIQRLQVSALMDGQSMRTPLSLVSV